MSWEPRPLACWGYLSPVSGSPSVSTYSSTFGSRESHHTSLTTGTRRTWGSGAAILTSGTLKMGGTKWR